MTHRVLVVLQGMYMLPTRLYCMDVPEVVGLI